MKKINVIDLDKTLIPFDSFRRYIFKNIRLSSFFPVLAILLFRKLRILKLGIFKKTIITLHRRNSNYPALMVEYAAELHKSINGKVMETIKSHTDDQTLNILVSASPDDYVKELSKTLGWASIASTLQDDEFMHAYGSNKIAFLESRFDPDMYIYNFAISDHDTDDELLTLFSKKAKLVKNTVVYL